jgi:cytidylate kinase
MSADAASAHTPIIITIDGPAGTGKSTVAYGLAARLGLEYLDTGAMYRAAALISIEHDIDPSDGPRLADKVGSAGMRFDWSATPPALCLRDCDVSARIRDMDVSAIVSTVAAQPEVRRVLVREQRRLASEHPRLVSEGRDQGSVVFPDAPVRFYLDAAVETRAQRRVKQLQDAGKMVDEDAVRRDIRERDRIDSTRDDSPLTRPDGSISVDTDDISAEAVIDRLESIVKERLPKATFSRREGASP